MADRSAEIKRFTSETEIKLSFCIDGQGDFHLDSGIPFFDHMLNGFTRHGLFDLSGTIRGDIEVDSHHTIEDTGIVLGEAIKEAIGDKRGIRRFGQAILPMPGTIPFPRHLPSIFTVQMRMRCWMRKITPNSGF